MNLAYFFQEAWEEAYIRTALSGEHIAFYSGAVQDRVDIDGADVEALSLFINSHIGDAELARFPKLKCIATRSTGFDHIDLAACAARGIVVSNVPFYGENTVAEFTFALILALSRKVERSHRSVVETDSFSQEGLRGFDLAGRTLGIVGGGHIGMRVARIARGFDMHVLVFDIHRDEREAHELGFSYAPLEDLLAHSDVVSLHVPYNARTHHLINSDTLAHLKKGAYLINTARGAIVDTSALIQALSSGILAGAGLDVLEEEGDIGDELELLAGPHPEETKLRTALQNHYLMNHPRVIVTPHVAFNTDEAIRRILDTTIQNLKAFEAGKPENVVS